MGGSWSGTGVVNNQFYPGLSGLGSFALSYNNVGIDCDIVGVRSITVVDLPISPTSEIKNISGCAGEYIELTANISEEDRFNNVVIEWYKEGEIESFNTGELISFQILSDEKVYYESVNQFGCPSGQRDYINVSVNNPTAVIEASAEILDFGFPVQFFAVDVSNVIGDEWRFGDGATSTEKDPYHYYYDSGTFNIKLIVHSVSNCYNEIQADQLITVNQETGRENGVVAAIDDHLIVQTHLEQLVGYYPTPLDKKLTIELISHTGGKYKVTANDLVGHQFELGNHNLTSGFNKIVLDTEHLQNGVYIVNLTGKKSSQKFKIIKL